MSTGDHTVVRLCALRKRPRLRRVMTRRCILCYLPSANTHGFCSVSGDARLFTLGMVTLGCPCGILLILPLAVFCKLISGFLWKCADMAGAILFEQANKRGVLGNARIWLAPSFGYSPCLPPANLRPTSKFARVWHTAPFPTLNIVKKEHPDVPGMYSTSA